MEVTELNERMPKECECRVSVWLKAINEGTSNEVRREWINAERTNGLCVNGMNDELPVKATRVKRTSETNWV